MTNREEKIYQYGLYQVVQSIITDITGFLKVIVYIKWEVDGVTYKNMVHPPMRLSVKGVDSPIISDETEFYSEAECDDIFLKFAKSIIYNKNSYKKK